MASRLSTVLMFALVAQLSVLPALTSSKGSNALDSKKYKFLYFASILGGSHYVVMCRSGRALVQQGHRVVSLVGSSNSNRSWQRDADVFSFVVFNSTYTKQNRTDVMDNVSKVILQGHHSDFFGPFLNSANLSGRLSAMDMWLQECDDLLGDSITMERLRKEKFDMLVTDDTAACGPLLAQALDIPFVHNSVFFAIPSKHGHWTGLPIEPSYIPARSTGFTNKMTFPQRVKNVLAHYFYGVVLFRLGMCNFDGYDKLKVKYNIKPEMSTLESYKQALLYFLHGSFAFEFARPMQPNTILVLHHPGVHSNQTLEDDVAQFLDTAPSGVVMFSMGSFVTMMELEQAQMFADAFAMLPHRVLWQSGADFAGLRLGNNTMVAKWLPLTHVMEHPNVRLYVCQGAGLALNEALWAGLPIVGLPLMEDQMDNLVRVEAKGVGLKVDIATMTPRTLSQSIGRVMTDPKFSENARRISDIMRDLETSASPVDTMARWILHLARFGGDHLRPAVQDLNFVQRNLLDVYLFLVVALALVTWINVTVFCFCLRCMCPKGWNKNHLKKE
ncbi:UDP-glucuronosyltransferase 2C1-like [Patiria miniata]|uniref:Glucuronosyltransferase n=1 Tax=Patiria miniata TaxID=46514 RepID=A0A913ZEJ4_PATMI|nr:UDP-glucuronosyltransferase 2C1-like [Patiria miniata]